MLNDFLKRIPQLSSVVCGLVMGGLFGLALPASAQQTANRVEGLRDHDLSR
jgi:hypothetical protein